ncbi:MAG: DUF1643 domain-containing protein [Nostoc sp.]|uniref:DUF1643 domain-containing protein n=1 Tax=Nostoc sp. NMS9 TaxID=2815393 RepID=UPI0025D0B941|nr:DUF1643 domain-containing protein [Nostoc sp. NMS9]
MNKTGYLKSAVVQSQAHYMERYADIDTTGKYRYLLGRRWDANLPLITFVMLNPSTAGSNAIL